MKADCLKWMFYKIYNSMMIEPIVWLFNDIQRLNLNDWIQLSASLDVSKWDHFLIFLSSLYLECRYGIFLLKALKNI